MSIRSTLGSLWRWRVTPSVSDEANFRALDAAIETALRHYPHDPDKQAELISEAVRDMDWT